VAVSPNANFDVVESGELWKDQIVKASQSSSYSLIDGNLPNVLVRPGNVLLSTKQLFSAIRQKQRQPPKSSTNNNNNNMQGNMGSLGSLSELQRSLSLLNKLSPRQLGVDALGKATIATTGGGGGGGGGDDDDDDEGSTAKFDVKEKGFVYVEYSTIPSLRRELMKNKESIDVERAHLLAKDYESFLIDDHNKLKQGGSYQFNTAEEEVQRSDEVKEFLKDLGSLFGGEVGEGLKFADFLHPTHRLLWIGTGGTVMFVMFI
jgi:hypothetical protein